MRIKFKSPDPRAGLIAQMDSSRGQQLIDSGNAAEVKGSDEAKVEEPQEPMPAKKAAKAKD